MRKLIQALLAAMLLTGCGGYQAPQEETPEETTQEEETQEEEQVQEEETQEEQPEQVSEDVYISDFPRSGFSIHYPQDYMDTTVTEAEGEFGEPTDEGETEYGSGVVSARIDYVLRTRQEREEFQTWIQGTPDELSDEDMAKVEEYYRPTVPILQIIGINGGRTADDILKKFFTGREDIIEGFTEIGQYNGFTYYNFKYNLEFPIVAEKLEGVAPEAIEDFKTRRDDIASHTEWFHFYDLQPDFVPPEIGTKITFTAKDLDGNEFSSEEIFSDHELTIVNIWRTWCGVCISEFPELTQIAEDFADRGAALVTYCADADGDDLINTAKDIADSNRLELTLARSEEINRQLPWQATPYTYFIDREGKVLCYPISGSDTARVRDYTEKLLNGETIQSYAQAPSNEEKKTYVVQIIDQNDEPVKGAVVSFCTDVTCDVAQSNEMGVAEYTGKSFPYRVHIVQLPDGYREEQHGDVTLDADSGSTSLSVIKE
ncbi:MAG: TlpA family protein disulfide reductase [Solobacterium sp.]|nr:TlpA family protein disulfide reductase [Solobacterium sp.]